MNKIKLILSGILFFALISFNMVFAFDKNPKTQKNLEETEEILIGACNKQNKCGYINTKGKVVIPFEYRFVDHKINEQDYAIVVKPQNSNYNDVLGDDYYGIIDKKGNVIVECNQYDLIDEFYDGRAEVIKDKKRGYLNKKGDLIIPLKYAKSSKFQEGVAVVSLDGKKYGTIDIDGNTVIPFEYDIIGYSQKGLHSVKQGKKWAIFNNKGKQITPFIFNSETRFKNNNTFVTINDKSGIIDENGNYILKPEYYKGSWGILREDLFELCKQNINGEKLCGIVNSEGKEIIPFEYKRVFLLGDNLYKIIKTDNSISYILPKGELEFIKDNKEFSSFIRYKDGYLVAVKNGQKGVLDKNGKVIVPFQFDDIFDFQDGIIRVEKAHRPAFYDKNGKNIVPLGKYMFADDFENGVAKVTKEHYLYLGDGLINTEGKEIIKPVHSELEKLYGDIYGAEKMFGGGGVYDKNGKKIIPFGKYSRIELFN